MARCVSAIRRSCSSKPPCLREGAPQIGAFCPVAQGVYGFFTGTAILNPNNRAIEVLIEVFDSNGTRVSTGTRTIVPNGRVTVVLSEIDPNLQLSEGYFKITSADDFAGFGRIRHQRSFRAVAVPPQLPN